MLTIVRLMAKVWISFRNLPRVGTTGIALTPLTVKNWDAYEWPRDIR